MVGEVADVLVMFEGHREGCSVVGLPLDAPCGLGAAGEVVLVVTDTGPCPEPVRLAIHSVSHREHHRLHSFTKIYQFITLYNPVYLFHLYLSRLWSTVDNRITTYLSYRIIHSSTDHIFFNPFLEIN